MSQLIKKISWKIGGEAGFGIKGAGEILARTFTRSGYYVFGYAEYPSLIRGGHNTYQASISNHETRSNSEKIDILVALNKETIDLHNEEINSGGVVIYDSTRIKENISDKIESLTYVPIPLTQIAKDESGIELTRNTVALGATIALLGADLGVFEKVVSDTFGAKGEKIVAVNERTARAGYEYMKQADVSHHFQTFDAIKGAPDRVLMTGNDAVALGAVAGGCQIYVAYPMTPASSVLHTLASLAEKNGFIVKHAEDEISVINMAIGASYAGARAMIGTSGGGFALMIEGLALSGMTETPLVALEVMRPGPATGLPTWTDQGDLRFLMHAGHGEFLRVLAAPGDLQEAFEMTVQAFYLSEKYHIPVIVNSDKFLAESHLTGGIFNINDINLTRHGFISNKELDDGEYKRYAVTDSGVSPRSMPGQDNGVYLSNSDEHDEYGFSDETSGNRVAQVEKRARKIKGLIEEIPEPILYGQEDADVTLIGWGSMKGPILDALEELEREIKVNFLHLTYILPFPREKVAETVSKARIVIIIENNSTAQMAGVIKEQTGFPIEHKLLKYDGRPWWPEEIVRKVKEIAT